MQSRKMGSASVQRTSSTPGRGSLTDENQGSAGEIAASPPRDSQSFDPRRRSRVLRLLSPFDKNVSRGRGVGGYFAFWSVALVAIAALLITVAVLQYRWTDQASSGEEMRIGAELESLMMKWHSDLYNEFSAICVAMQVGPDFGARDTWNDYLERYVEWNYAQPHQTLPKVYRNPELVGEIYILDSTHRPDFGFVHLNLDTRKIEDSAVPPELRTLVPRLRANSTNISVALHAWQLPFGANNLSSEAEEDLSKAQAGSDPIAGWQFDESVPAIVHPILHREAGKVLSNQSPVDWIIITIDESVLQKKTLPVLVNRYFGGLDGLDYRVAVLATGTRPRVIYSSDPGFAEQDLPSADKAMDIFAPGSGALTENSSRQRRGSNLLKSAQWQSSIVPAWFPIMEHSAVPEKWILKVQRRAAPLQTVVRRARMRNLSVSGLVLLFLAINIAVLTSTSYRAQQFARLQMEFVASVSHELRTPLSAIFAAGENLKDGVVTDRPGLAQYGSIILSQSRQLMNHIDRILLFASIRSGKDRYNLRPMRVAELLKRIREDTAALAAEESCTIEERIEPGVTRVMADPMAVCGCLENLVINAVKYSRDDRQVRIVARRERGEGGAEVAISVEDRGIGIKDVELKRIFEPFYRSPEARAAQIHGTGLGLSLAKRFAESMHGRLTVSSTLGQGSVFTLYLPVPREDDAETMAPTESFSEGDGHA
ncbi:HAMP domain-containing histidine kinase [Acidobacteria bacterium AB60]|nr:HAMP domain-containing histidine kinase [Acidobacteria bacterium AB60]